MTEAVWVDHLIQASQGYMERPLPKKKKFTLEILHKYT